MNLPKTSFPLRGGLPQKEPQWLAFWKKIDLETKRLHTRESCKPFVLHDGPPYANGHLHLGHAVNKIAKDALVRFWHMKGFYAPLVPGWDCHGLPIEAKVEENFKKKGRDKKQISALEFRNACKSFAQHWIDVQRTEFQRLGLLGQFNTPYTTMSKQAEAEIACSFLTLAEKGLIYRALRPVLWSVTEETALAEAEVEYKEITSPSLYVSFPLESPGHPALQGAHALIWTTTPWTLPANRAIAYGKGPYHVVHIADKTGNHKTDAAGKPVPYLLAGPCLQRVCGETGLQSTIVATLEEKDLQGLRARHPLYTQGYGFTVPCVPADHVTHDAGTGLVHTAPAHGTEDFSLAKPFDLEITDLITPSGLFKPDVPVVGGVHIYKAAPVVLDALEKEGTLFASGQLTHSYPHSWRSRTPLIYRATPQWFLRLDGPDALRDKALAALEKVTFFPSAARKRLTAMVQTRPDWCLSRQRAWGMPLTLFVNKEGTLLCDPKLNQAIVKTVNDHGADFWWCASSADQKTAGQPEEDATPNSLLRAHGYDPANYTPITDILDVWFESGLTHRFALHAGHVPADFYLEGSDQHRGWFQSSLVLGAALGNRAPFKNLLTHGYVVDDKGRKMSKSLGNGTTPMEITQSKGADVLRLWVLGSDLNADIKFSPHALGRSEEIYRRFRGTLRFLLGNTAGAPAELLKTPPTTLPLLEQWLLARLADVQQQMMKAFQAKGRCDQALQVLYAFCNQDLSAFYFDVRKDTLYCDAETSEARKAVQYVLAVVLRHLLTCFAIFLPFTAEEAFQKAKDEHLWAGNWGESVHLMHLEDVPSLPADPDNILHIMAQLRQVRANVTEALEEKRSAGMISSALEAVIDLHIQDHTLLTTLNTYGEEAFAELCLVSGCGFHQTTDKDTSQAPVTIHVTLSEKQKCPRCWRFHVPPSESTPQALCARCTAAEKMKR